MKRKTFDQKREEVKRLTETMNQSIGSYFKTPEHLAFMMQFYQYSLRNTALIQNQFKGAQAVGSYKFWQQTGNWTDWLKDVLGRKDYIRGGDSRIKQLAFNDTV
ncbi:hypothetical protein [Virgibacillus indicus]|uniref:hypothetical protein n=1 Tax=Virgibacillus indicus TaxID=2024554 RepID=UPI0019821EB4|nr:hypothetical protein [Virgibacillus indicus]